MEQAARCSDRMSRIEIGIFAVLFDITSKNVREELRIPVRDPPRYISILLEYVADVT